MNQFLEQLRSGCRHCELAGKRVLVAVSGGADSVALLRGLLDLREELSLELFVAHLNHQLRGTEADADANWVAELGKRFHLPTLVEGCDVARLAEEKRVGIEEAARDARYAFLPRVAQQCACPEIALAHTADDQAETVLHHLLRGTGLAGLRGIPITRVLPSGIRLVRPLRNVSRSTVEAYLQEVGQEYRVDHTNTDASYTRNRLRHELLPLLTRDYQPRLGEVLGRLGQQAEEIFADIQTRAEELLHQAVLETSAEHVRLNLSGITDQPRFLIREMFAELWRRQAWPRQGMGFAEFEQLAEWVVSGGPPIMLPGAIRVEVRESLMLLRK